MPDTPPYKPPVHVATDIFLACIPIPIPLRYINCYLFRGDAGWTIVDTGFHDPLARDAWPRTLSELGIRPQEISQILITHYHPDHIGGAGWLSEWTGAPVYLHDKEVAQAERFWHSDPEVVSRALADFFLAEGMDEATAHGIGSHHEEQIWLVKPLPEFRPVPTGSLFRLGNQDYETLWLPGHSDGLAVYWNAERSILVAGDMILDRITPNVSLWPNSRPNPLADYMASLARVEELNATLALTGHRNLLTDVSGRARAIRAHHAERLDMMERLCGGIKGATAWEVCQQVFPPEQLTIHQIRFAMSETLAHLVYMERQGRLMRKGNRFVQA